uniref:Uncharacterized protein n=1 Tax=Myoviridae sp. ctj3P51 TaxID=2826687 RepID=A0A8S5NNV9_9CAUD|nr:MAG TPA: hypothetical protein [Myoviridae sp. ctj3P51]
MKKLKITFTEDENKNIRFDCRHDSEEHFSDLEIVGLLSIMKNDVMEVMRNNGRKV